MQPEALTLPAEDHLRMQQQQVDMAQFEAEFNQQAEVGHVHTTACEHHHADAFIDHPEDHLHEPAGVHAEPHRHESHHEEREHDNHQQHTEAHHDHNEHDKHVHGPGCGHIEHGQAHEHIDHHVHSESCGHLHHGEAKEHVDHGYKANHSKHHHETDHGYVHHPGCGHVGYEHVESHVDKPHVHDANCGHLHRHEAEAHVDRAEKPKHEAHDHDHSHSSEHVHHPGCGHVGFEHAHEHADRTEHHDHEHHHIPETVKQEGLVAEHATHATEAARQQADLHIEAAQERVDQAIEAEQRIIQTVEPEPTVRPEVVEANVHEEQQRQIIEAMEALIRDGTDQAEQTIERSPDQGVVTQNEAVTPFSIESDSEPAPAPTETLAETDPVPETSIVEQPDDVPELYEVTAASEKPAESAEAHSELTQEVETIATPELAATDVVELEIATPGSAEAEAVETSTFTTDGLLAEVDHYCGCHRTNATRYARSIDGRAEARAAG
jgi:hypothetical protein